MFDFGVSLVTLTGTVNLHFCVERMWLCKFSHTADLNHGVVLNKQQFHSFLVWSFTLSCCCSQFICSLSGCCSQLVCSLSCCCSQLICSLSCCCSQLVCSLPCCGSQLVCSLSCCCSQLVWSVLWLLQSAGLFFVCSLVAAAVSWSVLWLLLQSAGLFFVWLL